MKKYLLTIFVIALVSLRASSQPWSPPSVDSIYYFGSDTPVTNWILSYAELFSHNAQGDATFYEYKDWDGSNWNYYDRYYFNYNASNNISYELDRYNNGGIWKDAVQKIWTYDANNNNTGKLRQRWAGGQWLNDHNTAYTYDTNNNQLTITEQQADTAGNLANTDKLIYTYDLNSNQTSLEWQLYTSGMWGPFFRSQSAYDANNNKTYSLHQSWQATISGFENTAQDTFVYDASQNLIETITQDWDNSAWVNDTRFSYTYDANNNRTNFLWEIWTGASWQSSEQSTYTYDANNNITSWTQLVWNGTSLADFRKVLYTYDAGNQLVSEVGLVPTMSGWARRDSTHYYNRVPGTCSALFNLYPDTSVLHHYFIDNLATGTGPLTYVWNWGDGTTDTAAYPSHTYATAGFYAICLTIRDSSGCTANNCSNFNLQRNNNAMVYVEVLQPVSTGITSQPTVLSFSISPNPATTTFTISIDESLLNSTATITDITGRRIMAVDLNTQYSLLTTETFANGIYFVTISNGTQSATKKLVVGK